MPRSIHTLQMYVLTKEEEQNIEYWGNEENMCVKEEWK